MTPLLHAARHFLNRRGRTLIALAAAAALSGHAMAATHGYAQFGEPKYPAGFTHFDYANPAAPKGGHLTLSNLGANSKFDKYNPFSLRGRAAPGLLELVFETLAVTSLDEPQTQYGLLAEKIIVAPDISSVRFVLRRQARFSNGDPVTAADVLYSWRTLTGKSASPRFASYFSEISRVDVVDPLTVEFHFTRRGRDLPFVAGSLPVFSAKWSQAADGSVTPFNDLGLRLPVASGPYGIERATAGRTITYLRRTDYWGRDIPVRRGSMNFDRVSWKLYTDTDTQVAGIRAGDFDFFSEDRMRYWCCQYVGHRFDSGELVKATFPHENPLAMVGAAFNIRRKPFDDPRVREALLYAFDYEWVQEKLFANFFGRLDSYFYRTPMAARGLPGADELALLTPWRDRLDPRVFGPAFRLPDTRPPGSIRQNLEHAVALLAQAGWTYRDGAMRNRAGEPLVVRVSGPRGDNLILDPYFHNLKRIGVRVELYLADPATHNRKMRNFDFDFIRYGGARARVLKQPAAELWRTLNSADADRPGSDNLIGVKSPVVDDLLQRMLNADTEQAYHAAGRALDRVLMHSHYVQPWRSLDVHYVIHHQRLRHPARFPRYYAADEWAIAFWWDGAASAAAQGTPGGRH